MGGCSSKPKTAEFEGVLEMQEELSQDGNAGIGVDGERIGLGGRLDPTEKQSKGAKGSADTVISQNEHYDPINISSETEKHLWAGWNSEEESVVKSQALEDAHINGEQRLVKEINADASIELQKADEWGSGLATASFKCLGEDFFFMSVNIPELKETIFMPLVESSVMNSLEEKSTILPTSSDIKLGSALLESGNLFVQKSDSTGLTSLHPQGKDLVLRNKSATQSRYRYKEEAKIIVFQENDFPEDIKVQVRMILWDKARQNAMALEFQESAMPILNYSPRENIKLGPLGLNFHDVPSRAGKGLVKSESEEAVHGNWGPQFVDNLTKKAVIEETRDCNVITTEAHRLGVHSGQSEREVLAVRDGGKSMPHQAVQRVVLGANKAVHDNGIWRESKNEREGINCPFPPVNGVCMLNPTEQSENDKSLLLKKNNNVNNDLTDIAEDVESSQMHCCNGSLHEGWMPRKVSTKQGNTFASAENDEPMPRPPLPMNEELPDSPMPYVLSNDSLYVLDEDDFEYCDPFMTVSKEPKLVNLPNNGNIVAVEKRTVAVSGDEAFSTAEQKVHPKIEVISKCASCIDVQNPEELVSNHKLVQQISALDIDNILEKLASEFERQESLAHSNS